MDALGLYADEAYILFWPTESIPLQNLNQRINCVEHHGNFFCIVRFLKAEFQRSLLRNFLALSGQSRRSEIAK